MNGKRSRVLLFQAKGQRSANLWLPGRTSVLKENLNISSSQILPYLYKDAGWCKEGVKNTKEQKGHLSRSIGMFSQRSLCFRHFSCFVSGLVFPEGSLLLQFDVFRWFRTLSFHHNHSLASIVSKIGDNRESRANHSNWRADVSLHWTWLQIWQTHSKTTYIMFTICRKNMLFSFKK